MSRHLLIAAAVALVISGTAAAAEPAHRHLDATAGLLDTLFDKEVQVEGNVNDMSLVELLNQLSKTHNVTFLINQDCFDQAGIPDIKEKKPNVVATSLKGLSLHHFIVQVLKSMRATYIIRGNAVEIVTVAEAARVAKAAIDEDAEGIKSLKEPLVCAIFKQKPLKESVELMANRYELNVSISPQAGEVNAGGITVRIMNLPADKAIEMLAQQHDLRVVRKGNAYLITSPEHAKKLLAEQAQEERCAIELEKLRANMPRKNVPTQPGSDPANSPKKILQSPGPSRP
jgi:type II secretory pathway component GspD/PulD (secretin)